MDIFFCLYSPLGYYKHASFRLSNIDMSKKALGGRVGRRGWDGGKHQPPGIPHIPPCQIPQALKKYFALWSILMILMLLTESAPLGRFSHRVSMSVCVSLCLSVCAIGCIFFRPLIGPDII